MITAYFRLNGQVHATVLTESGTLPQQLCWIDLDSPTDTERAAVARWLGINVPSQAEMEEIEISSRLYIESGVTYLTTTLLVGADSPEPELADLGIIVTTQHVISVRFSDPKSIAIFATRIKNDPSLVIDVNHVALGLLDAIADRTADMLEMTGRQVNFLTRQVFPRPTSNMKTDMHPTQLKDLLYGVGRTGDMLHRSYHSINGMIRAVAFLGQTIQGRMTPEQVAMLQSLQSDLRSLREHADFMIQESTFLLDATLGQINSEQNDIFRFLMMVSAVFLPSSLLAGVYGMNFRNLPGADTEWWIFGIFGLMVLSALTSLAYFKRRGWW